ncbi:MAG: hypothetical protein O2854_00635 [Chloroflexi bacterium]|nr:hypothetical protein [Chloroflexota bacterium]
MVTESKDNSVLERSRTAKSDFGHLTGPPCDICDTPMLDMHCKLKCLACGFFRDCSDP